MTPEAERLLALLDRYGRPPAAWSEEDTVIHLAFDPPLTDAEAVILADLRMAAKLNIANLAAFRDLKDDAALALAFLANPSPTTADAVAALKSVIRLLRAVVVAGGLSEP